MLQVCAEKFHRAPEECSSVTMDTLWELVVLAEEEAETLKKARESNGRNRGH